MDEETFDYLKESWNDFVPIARSLLQRIERFHTDLEPIVTPPD
jgi:hypothetical protein